MRMTVYPIHLFYSPEDEAYVADVPDLKYCSAFGDTPEEALLQVLIAKEAWLEPARANGKPVAAPRYRPAIYQVA
jgi:predicted RNase H-like HicB family nuclease